MCISPKPLLASIFLSYTEKKIPDTAVAVCFIHFNHFISFHDTVSKVKRHFNPLYRFIDNKPFDFLDDLTQLLPYRKFEEKEKRNNNKNSATGRKNSL